MSYQIELHREALAELKVLPAYVRAQAIALIDLLAATPRPPRAKELRDKPGIYRIWLAGRWRIAYEINDENGGTKFPHAPVFLRGGAPHGASCADATSQ